MTTTTKTFAFATTAESFVATSGTNITLSYDAATGNPAGALKSTTAVRNAPLVLSYWEWTGTWEQLGVPAGEVVTSLQLTGASTRCTVATAVRTGGVTIGPYEVRDSAGTLIGTLWAGRTGITAADASWVTTASQSAVTIPNHPSNTTIKIRLADSLGTANTAGATVTTYDDQVALSIVSALVLTRTATDPLGLTDGTTGITYTDTGTDPLVMTDAAVVTLTTGGGGGTAFTQTPTDALGLTDGIARDAGRGFTDPVGLTDGIARDAGRGFTETLGLTDATTISAGRDLSFTDPMGMVDATGTDTGKGVTDTLGITDGATSSTASASTQTPTDVLGLTDSVSLTLTLGRTDNLGLTDSASTASAAAVTLSFSDPLGLADSDAMAQTVTPIDVLGVTDSTSVSSASASTQNPADTLGLTDAVAFTQSKGITDPLGLLDTPARSTIAGVVDTLGLADAAVLGSAYPRVPVDTLGLTDKVSIATAITGTLHYTANEGGDYTTPHSVGINVHDVGMSASTIAALPAGDKALVWVGAQTATQAFKDFVVAQANNTRIFGYYLVDEPVDASMVAGIKEMADWIKANAPAHKSVVLLTDWPGTYAAYAPANTNVDLVMLDPYPVKWSGFDITEIDDAVNAALTAGWPLSSIVPVYQTFGSTSDFAWKPPTNTQLQQMLDRWISLVPNPPMDYCYTWGIQAEYGETDVLSNRSDWQTTMTEHFARLAGNRTLTFTDALGLRDATGMTRPQPVSDPLGLTDTAVVVKSGANAPVDPLGLADAVTVAREFTRVDSIGLTDTVTVTLSRPVNPVDNLGLTDAVAFTRSVRATDLMGMADSVSVVKGSLTNLIFTDKLGATDTASKTFIPNATAVDISVVVGPSRQRQVLTVGVSRTSKDVGPSRGSNRVDVGATRIGWTVGPTRDRTNP